MSPTSTVLPEGSPLNASPALRPARTSRRTERARCTRRPDTCCTPMLAVATARSTSRFCRYRRLVAMPPMRAGTMRLTNAPASWAAVVRRRGRRCGTAPSRPIAAARNVRADAASAPSAHSQSACLMLDHTPVTSASCGISRYTARASAASVRTCLVSTCSSGCGSTLTVRGAPGGRISTVSRR